MRRSRSNVRKRLAQPHPMDPTPIRPNPNRNHKAAAAAGSKNPKSKSNRTWLLLSLALAVVAIFALLHGSNSNSRYRYGIVIDGGSSGSRIHVFVSNENGRRESSFSMRHGPGLSSFASNPDDAGASLSALLDFAKTKVPPQLWSTTDVRLMATAGLRLLHPHLQDRILHSCRSVLRLSPFHFMDHWASVITGSDEGMFAWVVANYALGSLGADPLRTTGIIELGGASAQVTFVSNDPIPSEYSRLLVFKNITYNLYSHSFLHFGQNAAYDSLREALASGEFDSVAKTMTTDPCTPKGYSHLKESGKLSPVFSDEKNRHLSSLQSHGNFSECRSAALTMLQKGKDKCSYQNCYIGSTFMPKLRGKFLATENFFHTSKFFGLGQKSFLSELVMAGQKFCGEDWSTLKKRYKLFHEEDLRNYCFSSAYIVALLHDSLGIDLDEGRITVANQVEEIPLDWALGAFILENAEKVEDEQPHWIGFGSIIMSKDSPTLILVIAIFGIVLFMVWSISKWRKPQLKTIYDLEKGRYIVTRVARHR